MNGGTTNYQQEMAILIAEISFEQILFESLAEGDRKEESRLTILDLQLKIGRLKKTEDTYGAFGTVLRQHSLLNVLTQIPETDQLLSEVATFRTTLASFNFILSKKVTSSVIIFKLPITLRS